VIAKWLIGRETVLAEQAGSARARYGARQGEDLATRLKSDFSEGYSVQNLRYLRQFYLQYPTFLGESEIRHALSGEFSARRKPAIRHTPGGESEEVADRWKPGSWNPNLAWSLYRQLLKVKSSQARAFYEIEAHQTGSSSRGPV